MLDRWNVFWKSLLKDYLLYESRLYWQIFRESSSVVRAWRTLACRSHCCVFGFENGGSFYASVEVFRQSNPILVFWSLNNCYGTDYDRGDLVQFAPSYPFILGRLVHQTMGFICKSIKYARVGRMSRHFFPLFFSPLLQQISHLAQFPGRACYWFQRTRTCAEIASGRSDIPCSGFTNGHGCFSK